MAAAAPTKRELNGTPAKDMTPAADADHVLLYFFDCEENAEMRDTLEERERLANEHDTPFEVGFWDKVQTFISGSSINHVEIAIPVDKRASGGWPYYGLSASAKAGVTLDGRLYSNVRYQHVVRLPATLAICNAIFEFGNKHNGDAFSIWGSRRSVHPWSYVAVSEDDRQWFCASIVGAAIQVSGLAAYLAEHYDEPEHQAALHALCTWNPGRMTPPLLYTWTEQVFGKTHNEAYAHSRGGRRIRVARQRQAEREMFPRSNSSDETAERLTSLLTGN